MEKEVAIKTIANELKLELDLACIGVEHIQGIYYDDNYLILIVHKDHNKHFVPHEHKVQTDFSKYGFYGMTFQGWVCCIFKEVGVAYPSLLPKSLYDSETALDMMSREKLEDLLVSSLSDQELYNLVKSREDVLHERK